MLTLDKDYVLAGDPVSADTTAEGQVVFVGYGVSAPEFKYDDYAGIDVRGKIVATLYGAPSRLPTAPGAHFSSTEEKLRVAAAHGAIGLLRSGREEQKNGRLFRNMLVLRRGRHCAGWMKKVYPTTCSPRFEVMPGSVPARPPCCLKARPSPGGRVTRRGENRAQAFPLPVTVCIHIVSRYSEVESQNVAAILPGSDPQLKNEYVVFTAHLDHLGIGEPVKGDSIYNGATDNASGTAALLEMARAFSPLPKAPRRSLLFLAVTGEEEGLLGPIITPTTSGTDHTDRGRHQHGRGLFPL